MQRLLADLRLLHAQIHGTDEPPPSSNGSGHT
jgi:hypothetical protein